MTKTEGNVDGMTDATRTWEAFSAAIKEVCETWNREIPRKQILGDLKT